MHAALRRWSGDQRGACMRSRDAADSRTGGIGQAAAIALNGREHTLVQDRAPCRGAGERVTRAATRVLTRSADARAGRNEPSRTGAGIPSRRHQVPRRTRKPRPAIVEEPLPTSRHASDRAAGRLIASANRGWRRRQRGAYARSGTTRAALLHPLQQQLRSKRLRDAPAVDRAPARNVLGAGRHTGRELRGDACSSGEIEEQTKIARRDADRAAAASRRADSTVHREDVIEVARSRRAPTCRARSAIEVVAARVRGSDGARIRARCPTW